MKILQVHNRYKQQGGEEINLQAEMAGLRAAGHEVEVVQLDNESIHSSFDRVHASFSATYNLSSRRLIEKKIQAFNPDVVHVHNFFPLVSPSVYDACDAAGKPVVQTLHNYRIWCAAGVLTRPDGTPCTLCVNSTGLPALKYRCYQDSLPGTFAVVFMQAFHHYRKTWTENVSAYIAPSEFVKATVEDFGLPPEKVFIKPSSIALGPLPSIGEPQDYALFAGRLSNEKGLLHLLECWQRYQPRYQLKIAGDGPLRKTVEDVAAANPMIEYLGHLDRPAISSLQHNAAFGIYPSVCAETFGLTIVESFAMATPVIGTNVGAITELINDGQNGFLCQPGSAESLWCAINRFPNDTTEVLRMRENAQLIFRERFTLDKGIAKLVEIYQRLLV